MPNKFYQMGLAVIFMLSAVLFFTIKEAWRREPALELAVLSLIGIAALKAFKEEKQ